MGVSTTGSGATVLGLLAIGGAGFVGIGAGVLGVDLHFLERLL